MIPFSSAIPSIIITKLAALSNVPQTDGEYKNSPGKQEVAGGLGSYQIRRLCPRLGGSLKLPFALWNNLQTKDESAKVCSPHSNMCWLMG